MIFFQDFLIKRIQRLISSKNFIHIAEIICRISKILSDAYTNFLLSYTRNFLEHFLRLCFYDVIPEKLLCCSLPKVPEYVLNVYKDSVVEIIVAVVGRE